jgi:hypothetical protein
VYAGLTAASFFIAIFLQQVCGYTAFAAGLSLVPITLLMVGLSRRFGALSARIGPRLLMALGPCVGGVGMLLFTRVDERGEYVTQVLPATFVFGLGLALTVAPLTAAVLEAADRRHAGIASGVNNAIARVAGVLAIAVVGLAVSAQFGAEVDRRLDPAAQRDPVTRAYVDEARERPLAMPGGEVPGRTRAAVRDANVSAFHRGMIVSGLLMIGGGLIAAVGIVNPPRPEAVAQPPAVPA